MLKFRFTYAETNFMLGVQGRNFPTSERSMMETISPQEGCSEYWMSTECSRWLFLDRDPRNEAVKTLDLLTETNFVLGVGQDLDDF